MTPLEILFAEAGPQLFIMGFNCPGNWGPWTGNF